MNQEFARRIAGMVFAVDGRTRLSAGSSSGFRKSWYRTGVDSIQQISTVLIQAEKYDTPLGTALRVVA
jgi:hypothetical protein